MCCVFSCVLTVLRLAVADVTAVVRLRSPLLLLELSQPPSTGLALLENMPVRLRSNDISISDQREFLEFKCLQDGMVAVAACRYFSLPPPPISSSPSKCTTHSHHRREVPEATWNSRLILHRKPRRNLRPTRPTRPTRGKPYKYFNSTPDRDVAPYTKKKPMLS